MLGTLKSKIIVAAFCTLAIVFYGQKMDTQFAFESQRDLRAFTNDLIPTSSLILESLRSLENQNARYLKAVFSLDESILEEAALYEREVTGHLAQLEEMSNRYYSIQKMVRALSERHRSYSSGARDHYGAYIQKDGELDQDGKDTTFSLGKDYDALHTDFQKLKRYSESFLRSHLTSLQDVIAERQFEHWALLVLRTLIILVLAAVFYILVIHRLSVLTRAAQRLQLAPEEKVPDMGVDEIGLLSTTLETLREKSQDNRMVLEDLVEKRTEQLRNITEKHQSVTRKLAPFISPQMYRSIFEGKTDAKLDTHRKFLTVFFSDIVGFTSITDRMESEALNDFLNHYLNEMTDICLEHGGTLDKFIGDSVMVFFGDPTTLGRKEDALSCISMALEMQAKMSELLEEWQELGINEPLHLRIGISSGYCTVGNFGSDQRMDYTIIGGNVNLANRLEKSAPAEGILISKATQTLVQHEVDCEALEPLQLKGIDHPVDAYRVCSMMSDEERVSEIVAQTRGLELKLKMGNMEEGDSIEAIESLEKALAMLKKKEGDDEERES